VQVAQSLTARTPTWAVSLVESPTAPIILAGELGRQRIIWIGFDILESNWPLRVSFPIFIANAVDWLNPANARSGQLLVKAGDPFRLPLLESASAAQVILPDGTTKALKLDPTANELVFGDTSKSGVYRLRIGTNDTVFCVNLLDAAESGTAVLLLSNAWALEARLLAPSMPVTRIIGSPGRSSYRLDWTGRVRHDGTSSPRQLTGYIRFPILHRIKSVCHSTCYVFSGVETSKRKAGLDLRPRYSKEVINLWQHDDNILGSHSNTNPTPIGYQTLEPMGSHCKTPVLGSGGRLSRGSISVSRHPIMGTSRSSP